MEFHFFRVLTVVLLLAWVLPSCEREERRFKEESPGTNPGLVRQSDLQPGASGSLGLPAATHLVYDENGYAMNEGKRLFEWMNCVGCHAHGGGSIGPALIDDEWLYGSDPAQIYNSIAEGRPNGMPSFAGKIPDQQIWQLVSYVRSLNRLVPLDAAPGRDDNMNVKPPETQLEPQFPVGTSQKKR
jgi:cytochrome c oxidase cbb3-type subunit III